MNYIKQLNAFYDWLLINPLTPKEQALYLAILHLNNKAGWKREFTIANQTLQALCSMSKSELHKIRNKLEQKGLIEYKKGKRGKAGRYKISFLYETNTETNMETNQKTNMETNIETNVETNMEDINKLKLNETKQNKEDDDDVIGNSVSNFDVQSETKVGTNVDTNTDTNGTNPLTFYQKNIGPLLPSIVDLVNEYRKELPDELITEAFRLAVKNNVRSMRYAEKIMLSWLDKGIRTMDDYMRHEAEREHKKAAEAGREEVTTKRKYTQAEIEAAAKYIKKAVDKYNGNDVLEYIQSLGYPEEISKNAIELLVKRKELAI